MKAPSWVRSDPNFLAVLAATGLDVDTLWEWTEENRQRRERDGPFVGHHRPHSLWRSARASACPICRGRGRVFTGVEWLPCLDCDERGRVIHCVACAGRGALWLGGSDYLDCPECAGSGAWKPRREHPVPRGGILVAGRNLQVEQRLERMQHDA